MSVFFIVGSKCTLAALHAAPWWVTVRMPTGQTDRHKDGRTPHRYITLSARRGYRKNLYCCYVLWRWADCVMEADCLYGGSRDLLQWAVGWQPQRRRRPDIATQCVQLASAFAWCNCVQTENEAEVKASVFAGWAIPCNERSNRPYYQQWLKWSHVINRGRQSITELGGVPLKFWLEVMPITLSSKWNDGMTNKS